MVSKTFEGYLVLADISGYTSFLSQSELEHAHEILSELLELITRKLKPVLTISKLEGDAVFAYAPVTVISRGETLLEVVESAYTAFRNRIQTSRRHTTCGCRGCNAVPTLDLKFFLHFGTFALHNVGGLQEIVSNDVNLIHRLLKNHITEATGWRGYALFTGQCLQRLALQLEGLYAHTENYDHFGDVPTHSLNLNARYNEIVDSRRVFLAADDADVVLTQDLPASPPIVWDWLNDPAKRNRWGGDVTWTAALRPKGRTGIGARNHCAHGKGVSVETITDWRPFEYLSTETHQSGIIIRDTVVLEPRDDGTSTRMHDHMRIEIPLPRVLRRFFVRQVLLRIGKYDKLLMDLARLLDEEMKGLNAGKSTVKNHTVHMIVQAEQQSVSSSVPAGEKEKEMET